MRVESPCTYFPIVLNEPIYFDSYKHALKGDPYYQEFRIEDLGYSISEIDCGPMSVNFDANYDNIWELDPVLFNVDLTSDPYRFEVLYFDDYLKADNFAIRYGVYYIDYPGTQVNTTDTFLIEMTESCDVPREISAPTMAD